MHPRSCGLQSLAIAAPERHRAVGLLLRVSESSSFCRPLQKPSNAMLVHRLANNGDVVAFKMGCRQGGPSRTGGRGRISELIRNRRATRPPAHFQRNPPGRGQLAVFPRCSLGPYGSRYGRFARALKNSQLTSGDVTIICETMH